jgi:hypothetical protein
MKIGLELPVELHARMKSTAAARRMKLKQATRQAFEAWLGESSKSALSQQQCTPEEQKAVDAVLLLLRSGDQRIVSAVVTVLDLMCRAVKAGAERHNGNG